MSAAILIMTRASRPGEVKTRLEPLLGPQRCARLQDELIRHTATWVARYSQKTWLAFTPADAREDIAQLVPPTVNLFSQQGRDLGERLAHATDLAFRAHRGAVVVIGTDAPELGPLHTRFAELELVRGHDACLIPALDGGYALIALARPIPRAFELPRSAWGGPTVLELTMAAIHKSARSFALLDPVRDLDRPEDASYIAADPRCPQAIRDVLQDRTAV